MHPGNTSDSTNPLQRKVMSIYFIGNDGPVPSKRVSAHRVTIKG